MRAGTASPGQPVVDAAGEPVGIITNRDMRSEVDQTARCPR